MNFKSLVALILSASLVAAGPLAYGLCQIGCNMLAVSSFAAAGFAFGTVAIVAVPPVILACNAGLGTCMAARPATALVAPMP